MLVIELESHVVPASLNELDVLVNLLECLLQELAVIRTATFVLQKLPDLQDE